MEQGSRLSMDELDPAYKSGAPDTNGSKAEDDAFEVSDEFFEEAEGALQRRLKPGRFRHALGVSEMAVKLARIYGVDERKARLAGLLHDWDKCYNDREIRERVHELGVEVDPELLETMPHLLHGITAAAALKLEFPWLTEDVLTSIARHTSAAIGMSELDMVIYIADVIEPSREYEGIDELRSSVGMVDLEALFFKTYQHVFSSLVMRAYRVHPDTVKVWNYYVLRSRKGKDWKGSK